MPIEMDSQPVRCQKCGKPIGYVTVTTKNVLGNDVPLPNAKITAVCVNCKRPKYTVT
jgi:hypothetical protein